MKKLLVLVLAALGVFAAYRKWQAAQAEEDLWIEATSTPQADTGQQAPS